MQPPVPGLGPRPDRGGLAVGASGAFPAGAQGATVVPGGLDQQPAGVTVAGLGDPALNPPGPGELVRLALAAGLSRCITPVNAGAARPPGGAISARRLTPESEIQSEVGPPKPALDSPLNQLLGRASDTPSFGRFLTP